MTALIGFGIDSSETILNGNDKRAPVGTLFIWLIHIVSTKT